MPKVSDLKSQLMDRFSMTDMGDVSKVLGVQVTRVREAKTLTISQEHYARSALARSGMAERNPAQPSTYDWSRTGVISQPAGRDAARLYGHPTFSGHQGVSDVPEPTHTLRHRLRRQPTSPSREQTIPTTHDSSKTSSPL